MTNDNRERARNHAQARRQWRVTYRLDRGRPCDFTDVEIVGDFRPELGFYAMLPDGSGRYGRVMSVERV